MVNFARNRCFGAKKLPKTRYFHEKSSKTIDFSWFPLSELPYSKSQQPTCLPRGQVAPQVQVTNCVAPPTKQPDERGAPQSPLEESATTEASRMWHENMRVRWSYSEDF